MNGPLLVHRHHVPSLMRVALAEATPSWYSFAAVRLGPAALALLRLPHGIEGRPPLRDALARTIRRARSRR